jgi:hypothetical protein
MMNEQPDVDVEIHDDEWRPANDQKQYKDQRE